MKNLWIKAAMALVLCVPVLADDDSLEHVNFPLNSHVVVDAFQGLNLLAEVMVKYPDLELEVVGYTDAVASDAYNKNLSLRRANSVKAYLVSRGANETKVKVDGRGEANFVSDNESREGRFLNRRVELLLYETVDGTRKLVGYHRLIELFFGSSPAAAMKENHDVILQKLSDLEKQCGELKAALEKKLNEAPAATTATTDNKAWGSRNVHGDLQFNGFGGVSVDLGLDENDDFTARIKGQYFRALTDSFGIQAQGEYTHYDTMNESQFDGALVYQSGHFKVGGAASYKFIEMEGLESAGIGQGALTLDYVFEKGHIGLFGTAPFDDGDVVASRYIGLTFLEETYVEVVKQVGLSFGFNLGEKAGLSGSVAKLDTDFSSDLAANLRFEWNFSDRLTWYIDLERNENVISDEDSDRYATGLRWGSWAQARYMNADQVTPIDIPKIRYEMHTRQTRVGNTGPVVDAGQNQINVAAGTVTLSGTASDNEGDALTYSWAQISGPAVVLTNADKPTATFEGVAGASYTFSLTVRDTFGATGSDVVSIFMQDVPVLPPVVRFFNAIPDTINAGEFTTLAWSTENGDSVTIGGLGQVNAEGSLVLAPAQSQAYTITVTNSAGTVSETAPVTVIPLEVPEPNTPPVANAGSDQVNYFEGTVVLDGSGSYDIDGDELSYQWVQINGVPVTLSGANSAKPSFTSARNRAYTFRLIVTDGKGGIDTDDVIVQTF